MSVYLAFVSTATPYFNQKPLPNTNAHTNKSNSTLPQGCRVTFCMGKQRGRLTGRQTCRQTRKKLGRQVGMQVVRQVDRQAGRQVGRQGGRRGGACRLKKCRQARFYIASFEPAEGWLQKLVWIILADPKFFSRL